MLDWPINLIVVALGDRLSGVIATILIPAGVKPEEKDIENLTDEFSANMNLETAVEIIADFLALNRVSLIYQNMTRIKNEIMNNTTLQKKSDALSAASAKKMQAKDGESYG